MKQKNIFWGMIFLVIAACILITELGYFPGINIFKLLLTVVLIVGIIQSVPHRNFAGILFPLAFLCILFAKPLHITNLTPWPVLGIALFGSIGLSFLFPKRHWKKVDAFSSHYNNENTTYTQSSGEQESGSYVQAEVTFNSAIKYINSTYFERADLSASFGSLKVYFDQARPQSENLMIHTETSFGATVFYIPREWNVLLNVDTSFGNVEEKGMRNPDPAAPKVNINGDVSFGNLEINYI